WAPGDKEIAFVSDRTPRGIYAVAIDTSADRLVTADNKALAGPIWSADGKSVTYVAAEGPVTQLVVNGANVADAKEDIFPFRAQWLSPREMLYTADGVIKRRTIGSAPRTVAFSADVAFPRSAFVPKARDLTPQGPQPVRGMMHPTVSP